MRKCTTEIRDLLSARIDCIWVKTIEEKEAINDIESLARLKFPECKLHIWSNTEGLRTVPNSIYEKPEPPNLNYRETPALFEFIREAHQDTEGSSNIFILRDIHPLIAAPKTWRSIRDLKEYPSKHFNAIIMVGPKVELPEEISRLFRVVDYDYPDKDEVEEVIDWANKKITANEEKNPFDGYKPLAVSEIRAVVNACLGLTLKEIMMALQESMVKFKTLDLNFLAQNKIQAVKKTGVLDYKIPRLTLDDIGGNHLLKKWLYEQKDIFTPEAKAFGISMPKGFLAIGIPGTAC